MQECSCSLPMCTFESFTFGKALSIAGLDIAQHDCIQNVDTFICHPFRFCCRINLIIFLPGISPFENIYSATCTSVMNWNIAVRFLPGKSVEKLICACITNFTAQCIPNKPISKLGFLMSFTWTLHMCIDVLSLCTSGNLHKHKRIDYTTQTDQLNCTPCNKVITKRSIIFSGRKYNKRLLAMFNCSYESHKLMFFNTFECPILASLARTFM